MILNFEYLIVFTSAPGVLPQQNDRYRIQPWKVNEIKAYNKIQADFKYCFLFLKKCYCNLKKMKIYKNFDEIRGKI